MRDEELTAAGVGPVERHADGASQVRALVDLIADGVTGPAFAVAARISVLNDEVGYHAVNAQAVEEILSSKRHEVLDRQRRIDDGELDLNRATVGIDVRLRRHLWIGEAQRFVRLTGHSRGRWTNLHVGIGSG